MRVKNEKGVQKYKKKKSRDNEEAAPLSRLL